MTTDSKGAVVVPLLSCPVLDVTSTADAVAMLRSKDLYNSDGIWAGIYRQPGVDSETCLKEFEQTTMQFCNGAQHRSRRKLLNQLVRPDALDTFRDEIIAPQSNTLLPRFVTGPHPDGKYRVNLNPFCDRVFLHFAAKFIGLVGIDTDERMELLRSLVSPITAAFTSSFYNNRAEINAIALDAKARYLEEFYLPSRDAQRALLKEARPAGSNGGSSDELSAKAEPMNFLQIVVSGAHPDYLNEEQAIRESLMLFNASVGTSTQTIINTVAELAGWLAQHPEDRELCQDDGFLLDAMEEALRLWSPFTPYNYRLSTRDVSIRDHEVVRGQEIRISIPAANRDTSVWGSEATSFNPRRTAPGDLRSYGLGFGVGPHQCLGQRVVMGSDGTGGAHVRVLARLFGAGVRPDPDNPPAFLDRSDYLVQPTDDDDQPIDILRWTSFPVVLDSWDPEREGANGDLAS